jgi:hypothetical protein
LEVNIILTGVTWRGCCLGPWPFLWLLPCENFAVFWPGAPPVCARAPSPVSIISKYVRGGSSEAREWPVSPGPTREPTPSLERPLEGLTGPREELVSPDGRRIFGERSSQAVTVHLCSESSCGTHQIEPLLYLRRLRPHSLSVPVAPLLGAHVPVVPKRCALTSGHEFELRGISNEGRLATQAYFYCIGLPKKVADFAGGQCAEVLLHWWRSTSHRFRPRGARPSHIPARS